MNFLEPRLIVHSCLFYYCIRFSFPFSVLYIFLFLFLFLEFLFLYTGNAMKNVKERAGRRFVWTPGDWNGLTITLGQHVRVLIYLCAWLRRESSGL